MKQKIGHKSSSVSIMQVVTIGGLGVFGIVVGAALALVVSLVMRGSCAYDIACHSRGAALLGGVALTQALNIIVIYALARQQAKQKRGRSARTT